MTRTATRDVFLGIGIWILDWIVSAMIQASVPTALPFVSYMPFLGSMPVFVLAAAEIYYIGFRQKYKYIATGIGLGFLIPVLLFLGLLVVCAVIGAAGSFHR